MTNAELAEWFGIQVNSFRARKEKKLEELKNFADFKVVDSKKVYIIKVYKPVYVKKKSNKSAKEFRVYWTLIGGIIKARRNILKNEL